MTSDRPSDATPPEEQRSESVGSEQTGSVLEVNYETIVALQTTGVLNKTLVRYRIMLKQLIAGQLRKLPSAEREKIDKKVLRSHIKKLLDFDNFMALTLIWKESPWVSREEVDRANLKPSFDGEVLTRRALARAMQKSDGEERMPRRKSAAPGCRRPRMAVKTEAEIAAEHEARQVASRYMQRANRLVAAAVALGLIAPLVEGQDDAKPLEGTELLHRLMKRVGVGHADDMKAEMVDDEGGQSPPGDGEAGE